jgi:nucleotide-binding universal stress UspA family protein
VKVLLAVDGSAASQEAAQFFCRLPHEKRLDVTVLTVVGLPDIPLTASTDIWYSKFVEGQNLHGEQVYKEIAAFFDGANVDISHLTKQGHVGHSIVTSAEELNVDLIVIGSVGHTNLDRLLLGSVSDYVSTHAAMSVLIVRPQGKPRGRDSKLKITIAYDDSKYSRLAVDRFGEFAWVKNAEVDLLSVVPLRRILHHGLIPAAFERSDDAIREVTRSTELAATQLCKQHIQATAKVVEAEHIGECIVESTNQTRPDLVVLGNRGRSSISRILLGSVSQYVLRHSNQSIWIVRTP